MVKRKGRPSERSLDALERMRETGDTQTFSEADFETVAADLLRERGDTRSIRLLGKQAAIEKEQTSDLRKLIDRVAWQDRLIDELRDHATPLKPFKVRRASNPDKNSEHMLLTSDWQYGQLVSPEYTKNLGNFSSEICEARVMEMAAQVIAVQEASPVERLTICLAGDLIENDSIFAGQHFEIDKHAIRQTLDAAALLAQFVQAVSPYYKKVVVISVLGNHGRMNGVTKDASVSSNLDIMTMKHAEALASQIKNVTWHVETEAWFQIFERFGVDYLLVHGDDMSLSAAGMEKYGARWRSLVGCSFRYVLAGHHHRPISWEQSDYEIIVNGSVAGSSGYSLKKMGLGNASSQLFFGIGKPGIIWTRKLRLDEATTTRKVKKLIG